MQRVAVGIGAVMLGMFAILVARSLGGGTVGSAVVVGGLLVAALVADSGVTSPPTPRALYTADEAHATMKGQGARAFPYLEVDTVRQASTRVASAQGQAGYRPRSPEDV
jgi:hypothetical protein